MRLLTFLTALLVVGCTPSPQPVAPGTQPSTSETSADSAILGQLVALNREAESLLQNGNTDKAAETITKAQPLMNRLLSVRQPALPAMEAASDLDDLYGRMLLANRHYGWARMQFQKNRARWKNWAPPTSETARRLKAAESAIAECDRKMVQ